MKRLLLISTFVVLVAGPAMAADQAVRVYKRPRPVVLAAPVYNWTGFYVGGNAGYGVGTNNSTTGSFTQAGSASYSDDDGPVIFPIAGGGSTLSGDRPIQSGFLGGAQFGYNYQLYPTVIQVFLTKMQHCRQSSLFRTDWSSNTSKLASTG